MPLCCAACPADAIAGRQEAEVSLKRSALRLGSCCLEAFQLLLKLHTGPCLDIRGPKRRQSLSDTPASLHEHHHNCAVIVQWFEVKSMLLLMWITYKIKRPIEFALTGHWSVIFKQ